MTGKSIVCVLAVSCFILASIQPLTQGQERKEKVRIFLDTIGKSVDVIGRLGVALGTMVTVTGTWQEERSKPATIYFVVDRVDGMRLDKAARFHVTQMIVYARGGGPLVPRDWEDQRRLDGKTWTLRAYERGQINFTPATWPEESGQFIQRGAWETPIASDIVAVKIEQ